MLPTSSPSPPLSNSSITGMSEGHVGWFGDEVRLRWFLYGYSVQMIGCGNR